ncbi:MAG: putative ABC exporter domain-containing protein [Acidobacteriia bacterium]|nr:putative ABC exporter domain-containing protein [Terriglobia bacterium]
MFAASLYIIVCSMRNRLRVRLRRLREPRYLLGAIAGIAYFYFAIFARLRGARAGTARAGRNGRPLPVLPQTLLHAGGPIAGAGLLVLAALAWLVPAKSSLLEFTEPEVQFLFPAPVSRRDLLVYRILRSQIALVFGAVISALFVPAAAIAPRLRFAAGMWVLFVTIRVYFAGVTLARSRLAGSTGEARRVAWAPLAVIVAALGIVGTAIARVLMTQPMESPRDVFVALGTALDTGAARVIVMPFLILVRPQLTTGLEFVNALAWAAAVMVAVTLWVVRSDAAFQDMAAESAERRAERKASGGTATKVRAVGWTLAPSGPAEGVFLWKNAMQMLRNTSGLTLFRYVVPLLIFAVGISSAMMSGNRARGGAAVFCLMGAAIAGFAVLLGPQIVRTDMRDDLRHLEVLKTWPLRPAAVIRGEMLWNGLLITGIAWLALICAAIFSAAAFPNLSILWRSSLSLTALLLTPALVFGQLTVHNATAVLFPAWVPLGSSRPRGLDMMGQRLLLLAAVLITLAIFMLPGVIVGGALWFAFSRFIGAAVLVPGAAICLGIVAIEVLAITEALGPAYERLDLTGIERPE